MLMTPNNLVSGFELASPSQLPTQQEPSALSQRDWGFTLPPVPNSPSGIPVSREAPISGDSPSRVGTSASVRETLGFDIQPPIIDGAGPADTAESTRRRPFSPRSSDAFSHPTSFGFSMPSPPSPTDASGLDEVPDFQKFGFTMPPPPASPAGGLGVDAVLNIQELGFRMPPPPSPTNASGIDEVPDVQKYGFTMPPPSASPADDAVHDETMDTTEFGFTMPPSPSTDRSVTLDREGAGARLHESPLPSTPRSHPEDSEEPSISLFGFRMPSPDAEGPSGNYHAGEDSHTSLALGRLGFALAIPDEDVDMSAGGRRPVQNSHTSASTPSVSSVSLVFPYLKPSRLNFQQNEAQHPRLASQDTNLDQIAEETGETLRLLVGRLDDVLYTTEYMIEDSFASDQETE